ncbi:MAG: tRNA(ile)-lysidine synthetase, tRNA(Ile)-lysidine synthase [Candidatus Peregrinibacteria bacterium GW2011_GWF2_33_10]|nr:MAG: tRNA(ile)-lysidine synthetase, tRNA(Ile)-lysidine synthase [Candidatus Peregrinibacteria bacterium GW2011_GWF2_33_10]OGJ46232.1 MAG: tRNA lysidine(34) synthetase TilS [Candidatus Peregrinibacteria bacterium RIFOXYA2_FULL_33_21]OGJ46353.1 MAG: tRNA lysidine(34) synthetase TilS [Candidatus Peregrinibacteria bacterium RIFOXYA12_FULL_33_12]OGJ50921.1 MAG: tRNA lysidine(34) synthetase TilS [Candidatus Peregrinibacteria bacterium RIFOXYB2_FULL_33_20]
MKQIKKKIQYIENLNHYVKNNDVLVVAVSGGVDSIVLLHLLMEFNKSQSIQLIVAHVNHNLRAKNSDNDEKLVKEYAKHFKLKFESTKIKWPSKRFWSGQNNNKNESNLEAKCREKRYEFLRQIKKRYKAKYIITGHHLNDNLETFLINFVRGASLNGLSSMQINDNDILRPLLNSTKEEIFNYAKKHQLKWREDVSNQNVKFARNRLRLKVVTELKKINPNLEQTFSRNLQNLNEINNFLEQSAKSWRAQYSHGRNLELKAFRLLNIALQKTVLVQIYKDINVSTYKLSASHLDQILKIINDGRGNVKKEFGDKNFIKIEKNIISFLLY